MGDESKKPRGERTRQKILRAAHELFTKQGYHGTSMRQIAQKVDLALGGLYNHFPGKEQVFRAVFEAYHPVLEVLPALTTARGDTVEEFLQDAVDRIIDALEKRPQFINLLFIEVVEFKSAHMGELFISNFPMMMEVVQRIYQKNQDRLRPMPLPMFVRTFMGVFFSYYLTEILFAPVAPAEFSQGARDNFIQVYLHGILTDSARQQRIPLGVEGNIDRLESK